MRLTVATWNLYLGADLALLFDVATPADLEEKAATLLEQFRRNDFAERAVAIAGVLGRERVDVVGLQELSRWTRTPLGSGSEPPEVLADYLPVLLDALERQGTPYDVHALVPSFEGALPVLDRWYGLAGANAILVRRGAGLHVVGERTGRHTASAVLRTRLGGVEMPVLRGWGAVDLVHDGEPLRVLVTHTEAWDPAARDAQYDEVLDEAGPDDHPTVLLADLNAVPHRLDVPTPWVDAWSAAGNDAVGGLTCCRSGDLAEPESSLWGRIDYVLARRVAVTACRVAGVDPADRTPSGLWPSDHAAVVAEIEL